MGINDIIPIYFPELFRDTTLPDIPAKEEKTESQSEIEALEYFSYGVSEMQNKLLLMGYIAKNMDKLLNSKTKIAMWIVENLESGELTKSQRDIAKETGASLGTVESTMKILQEGDNPFLIKSETGNYTINCQICAV